MTHETPEQPSSLVLPKSITAYVIDPFTDARSSQVQLPAGTEIHRDEEPGEEGARRASDPWCTVVVMESDGGALTLCRYQVLRSDVDCLL